MDLYTLDANFNKTQPIEGYASVIWTERFGDAGDVVLVVEDTAANRTLFGDGAYLGSPESDQVMVVDTADIKGGSIKLSGFTLDKVVFENRIILDRPITENGERWFGDNTGGGFLQEVLTYLATTDGWNTWATAYFGGDTTPHGVDMPKQMFSNLVFGPSADKISTLHNISNRQIIWDLIKAVGAAAKIGWKLVPTSITPSSHNLTWSSWDGLDRTSEQTVRTMVRFSPGQESLSDVSELRSKRDYKTVAYAISPDFDPVDQITGGVEYTGVAYAYPAAETETGLNRRVMIVEKTGLTTAAVANLQSQYNSIMNAAAADALANNNFVKIIDGEVIPQGEYAYGVDYYLGDIIELADPHGTVQKARITEYIRSSDANGFRAYPTVSIEE